MEPFKFVQPVGGKLISWKPLTVGQEMEIEAAFTRPEMRYLQKYEMLRRRIVQVGDTAPASAHTAAVSLEDMKKWDSFDLEMFAIEVEQREAQRRLTLQKTSGDTSSTVASLETAAEELRVLWSRIEGAVADALAHAKAARDSAPLT